MKIISINLNGIRSAWRKGFHDWLQAEQADVICMQEIKAQVDQLTEEMLAPVGYEGHFFSAQKRGYSGVAIYTKQKPQKVVTGLGWEHADNEGRYIQVDYPNLSVISLYMPSGSSGELRQNIKFSFMEVFEAHLKSLRRKRREFVICGDWNIAHKEIDLKNWRGNKKNSGFLPEERAWMDKVFDDLGYIDAFRHHNKEADQYTWWSNRGRAYENNVGWRIDYQIVTPRLMPYIKDVSIYKDQRFSDHAPLIVEYHLP